MYEIKYMIINLNYIFVTINLKNNNRISSIEKNKNITLIVDGIKEKKGKDIIVIDLKNNTNAPCSFFVICSAGSKTQINAIANNIEYVLLNKLNIKKWQDEGKNSNWRLLDYANIVIHILTEDARRYYQIEELWGDKIIKNYTN